MLLSLRLFVAPAPGAPYPMQQLAGSIDNGLTKIYSEPFIRFSSEPKLNSGD
jgi:hypothetical protein